MSKIFQWRYRRAMFRAINKACQSHWDNRIYSKTFGLRVIKRFEAVNNIPFNPFDRTHIEKVSGCARHEHFFWKAKRLLPKGGERNERIDSQAGQVRP